MNAALLVLAAAVNFAECPKCDRRFRISDDGRSATVNLSRLKDDSPGAAALERRAAAEPRAFTVEIDGRGIAELRARASGGVFKPVAVESDLAAGVHSVRLLNRSAPAPDIDVMYVR
ncbi:MAG: hypothetical protein J6T01_07035 [Kiritimatiellae bacterium]|nr:hypothetical protein [Kiritimatiellia bacterium]